MPLNEASGTAGGYLVPIEQVEDPKRRKKDGERMAGQRVRAFATRKSNATPQDDADWAIGEASGDLSWAIDIAKEEMSDASSSDKKHWQDVIRLLQSNPKRPGQLGYKTKKTVTRYIIKCSKGYVTKDDSTYTDDKDDAEKYDDPAEAQTKADSEDGGEVEETEEESDDGGSGDGDGTGNDDDQPFVAKPSAKHAAMLYKNAQDEEEYVKACLKDMDHPGMAQDLQKYHDKFVAPRQQALKEILHKHHGDDSTDPDELMEKVAKGLETDGTAAEGTGEAAQVERGQVSPDDATDDSQLPHDPDTEEINERYQDPDTKKWYTKTVGVVRRGLNGKLYVKSLKTKATVPSDKVGDGAGQMNNTGPDDRIDDDSVEAVKDASDYMTEASNDDQVPGGHRSAMKSHAKRLGQVHKALTNMGKIQANGGRGSELTDEGTAGNKGSMKDKGDTQGKPPKGGSVSYEGGEGGGHELKSWEKDLIGSMEKLRQTREDTRKVMEWTGFSDRF